MCMSLKLRAGKAWNAVELSIIHHSCNSFHCYTPSISTRHVENISLDWIYGHLLKEEKIENPKRWMHERGMLEIPAWNSWNTEKTENQQKQLVDGSRYDYCIRTHFIFSCTPPSVLLTSIHVLRIISLSSSKSGCIRSLESRTIAISLMHRMVANRIQSSIVIISRISSSILINLLI